MQRDLRAMPIGNGLDDRQPEPAGVLTGMGRRDAGRAVDAFEHALARLGGDAGAIRR